MCFFYLSHILTNFFFTKWANHVNDVHRCRIHTLTHMCFHLMWSKIWTRLLDKNMGDTVIGFHTNIYLKILILKIYFIQKIVCHFKKNQNIKIITKSLKINFLFLGTSSYCKTNYNFLRGCVCKKTIIILIYI